MHGAAVGEHFGQLVVGHARPVPDRAGIHVHERRAGGRIEADAAALQAQSHFAQFFQIDAGNGEIHRLAGDVIAVLGDAARAGAQHGVGAGRAIAADHFDRLFAADVAIGEPQDVEQLRVHADGFVAPPVAHEPVELLQRGVVVAAVALVGDGDGLAGMKVMKRQGAGVALGRRGLQRVVRAEQDQAGEAERQAQCRAPPRGRAQHGQPIRLPTTATRCHSSNPPIPLPQGHRHA